MGPSTTVPQDIIDEIVNNTQDDLRSLKACSLAARPFYQPTRKHLFAAIILDHTDAVAALDRALTSNPSLSVYIRSLEIPYLSQSTTREVTAILPRLSQIHRVVLGDRKSAFAVHPMSSTVSKTLSEILQLPQLENLEICSLHSFPTTLLHAPHRLKYLSLRNVVVLFPISGTANEPLLHLRSVHLHRVRNWESFQDVPGINAPNLRQVIVGEAVVNLRAIIQAGVGSIETVIWDDYARRQTLPVERFVGVLRNLRHLCIVFNSTEEERHARDPIDRILRRDGFSERLEKFTFVIGKARNDFVTVPVLGFLVLGEIWKDLVDRLRFPRLTNVTIRLINEGRNLPPIDPETFHPLVSQELPLLAEAGLLRTIVCKQLDWDDPI